MQNINKFVIGAATAASASGDQQHLQQENNYRSVSGGATNLVSDPVRAGPGWPRRHSQISIATTSCQDNNRRPPGRRVYVPSNQARAFRAIRDDERDDALAVGRRDQMMMEWNPRHTVIRKESAFTSVPYRGEVQQHRLPTRGPEQQPLTWHPIAEREWRRHHVPTTSVLRETRTATGERIHVTMAAAAAPPSSHYEAHYEPSSTRMFQSSSGWSRGGGFPTVAQINSYNQQLRTDAEVGLPHHDRGVNLVDSTDNVLSHPGYVPQKRPQQQVHAGVPRDVQTITLSSSTGSSTTASATTCRSPTGSRVGEKRMSETQGASPPLASVTSSPSSNFGSRYDSTSSIAADASSNKRHKSSPSESPRPPPPPKFDMLDLLCRATLEMGPLQENPSGCSCPKSKCIALYCDCFKAGRRCNPGTCTCLNCKNTVDESGPNGARTVAIRTILARNPRAFTTAGMGNPPKDLSPGQVACNCIRSRCLKLYCGCFQAGKACDPAVCTCISCLNTEEDETGARQSAVQQCLEKRPNAFEVKPKEVGTGCACKNNRCVRKYCECFRNGLSCTDKCTCRECENPKGKVPE